MNDVELTLKALAVKGACRERQKAMERLTSAEKMYQQATDTDWMWLLKTIGNNNALSCVREHNERLDLIYREWNHGEIAVTGERDSRLKALEENYAPRLKAIQKEYGSRLEVCYQERDSRLVTLYEEYAPRQKVLREEYGSRLEVCRNPFRDRLEPLPEEQRRLVDAVHEEFAPRLKAIQEEHRRLVNAIHEEYAPRLKALDEEFAPRLKAIQEEHRRLVDAVHEEFAPRLKALEEKCTSLEDAAKELWLLQMRSEYSIKRLRQIFKGFVKVGATPIGAPVDSDSHIPF